MILLGRTPSAICRARVCGASYHSGTQGRLTIGLRREDPQRIWERRCPLTPEAVHELVTNEDVDVLVQPCERRVWRMEELLKVSDHFDCFIRIAAEFVCNRQAHALTRRSLLHMWC